MRNCFRFLHTLSLACLRKILMPKRVGSHPRQWWIFDWFSRREKFRGQQQFQFSLFFQFQSYSQIALCIKPTFMLLLRRSRFSLKSPFLGFSPIPLYYCMMLKKSHLSYKTRNCNTAGEERKPLWFYTYYSKGKSKNGEPRGCKIIWIFSSRTKRNICGDKFISCSLETSAPKLSVVADKKMKIGEDCQNPSSSFKEIEVTKIEWSDRKRCEINHSSNIRESKYKMKKCIWE